MAAGAPRTIPDTTGADFRTSISRDGILAFARITGVTSSDIEVLSLRGETHLRPVVNTSAFEGGAQFSPDGRWMAYSSDKTGQI